MNVPQGEAYPLQGGYYRSAPPVVQSSMGQSVVIQNNSVSVSREMPQDHFIWSLCCFLYSNPCCMGLAALIQSVRARDRKLVGDIEGARKHGNTARTLNIISTVLFCLGVLIAIIIISVTASQASAYGNSYRNYRSNYGYGSSYGSYNGK